MRPPLDGTVLVTGASSGIGLEFARQLAGRARALVLVARRGERLETLAAELAAARPELVVSVQRCDLADLAAAEAMVARVEQSVGPIDVLINNAGVGCFGLYEHAPWERIAQIVQLNVTSLAWLTRRLLPGMLARGRGGVLNVSSGFGLTFLPGFAAYVGSKHFVTGFTEALRAECQPAGVVVSQLCPGPVATEFEEVAGSDQMRIVRPGLLTAAACVRKALARFARGHALIVPGLVARILVFVGRTSPRWLQRLYARSFGRGVRRWHASRALPEP